MNRRSLLASALASPALAWVPDRPLRLIIPFAPGGTNDIIGRQVAEGMGARLGQSLIVENRGGAGGVLGSEMVAKAAPDGYTLLLGGSGSLVINSFVHRRVPYDPVAGFAPIGMMASGANIVTVHPGVPARNLAELQALAKRANPPMNYASSGVGTTSHLASAMLCQAMGVEMEHIPYRGTGPLLSDLVAGRVQMFTNALAPMQPQVEAGTIRALAIASPTRNAALPNLPTTAEAGFPGVLAATWFALFATGGTPPDRIATLHEALNGAMSDPVLRGRITEGGVDVETSASPADFSRFYLEERARWGAVVRAANIQAE